MKTLNQLFCLGLVVLVMALAACGSSPGPATASTPGGGSGGNNNGGGGNGGGQQQQVTVYTFIFQNSIGICDAIRNWDPQTETVVFPATSAVNPPNLFRFEESGVYITDGQGGNPVRYGIGGNTYQIIKAGNINNPNPECTITVTDGVFIGVN